jgi:hypothetical protein
MTLLLHRYIAIPHTHSKHTTVTTWHLASQCAIHNTPRHMYTSHLLRCEGMSIKHKALSILYRQSKVVFVSFYRKIL